MEEKELEAVQAENEEQKTEQQVEQKEEKKEKVEVKNEQPKELTDDELYAQIQTEKLLKKKKVKRIVTFSSLCLAFVLAVCLIVLAVVPVSLKPRCAVDGFTTIELYHSTQTLDPDIVNAFNNTDLRKDKFELFMEKYNESFKTSYLSAIFNGSLLSYTIDEAEPRSKDSGKTEEEFEETYFPGALKNRDCYFAKLDFGTERKFVKQNGQVYTSRYYGYNNIWDGTLSYRCVFVEINQTRSDYVNFYVMAKSPFKENDELINKYHWVSVQVKADTNPIYNAWGQLTAADEV